MSTGYRAFSARMTNRSPMSVMKIVGMNIVPEASTPTIPSNEYVPATAPSAANVRKNAGST